MPTTLSNGWTVTTGYKDSIRHTVSTFNGEFPDADLVGAAYTDGPDGLSPLLLLAGQGDISDAQMALVHFGTARRQSEPEVGTLCGDSDAGSIGCVVDTNPSVAGIYVGDGDKGLTRESLANLLLDYQADHQ